MWGKGMKSGFACKSCAVWFALSSHLLTCCAERVISRCFQLSVLWVLMSILRLLFILVIRCNLGSWQWAPGGGQRIHHFTQGVKTRTAEVNGIKK